MFTPSFINSYRLPPSFTVALTIVGRYNKRASPEIAVPFSPLFCVRGDSIRYNYIHGGGLFTEHTGHRYPQHYSHLEIFITWISSLPKRFLRAKRGGFATLSPVLRLVICCANLPLSHPVCCLVSKVMTTAFKVSCVEGKIPRISDGTILKTLVRIGNCWEVLSTYRNNKCWKVLHVKTCVKRA